MHRSVSVAAVAAPVTAAMPAAAVVSVTLAGPVVHCCFAFANTGGQMKQTEQGRRETEREWSN